MDEMNNANLKMNTFLYNSLMTAYLEHGMSRKAAGVLASMQRNGVPWDVSTYALAMKIAAMNRDEEGVRTLAARYIQEGFPLDCIYYTTLMKCYDVMALPHEALQIFDSVLQSGLEADEVLWYLVFTICLRHGLYDAGERWYKCMVQRGFRPSERIRQVVDLLRARGVTDKPALPSTENLPAAESPSENTNPAAQRPLQSANPSAQRAPESTSPAAPRRSQQSASLPALRR
jgi:pentatricopeptide repeat protein